MGGVVRELPFTSVLGPWEMEEQGRHGASEEEKDRQNAVARQVRGAALAGGIFVCLLSYGYFQEKIMTGKWGNDGMGGRDISSVFLVMCNRLTSMGIAVIGSLVKGPPPHRMHAPAQK